VNALAMKAGCDFDSATGMEASGKEGTGELYNTNRQTFKFNRTVALEEWRQFAT
jgi:hypothetical protein